MPNLTSELGLQQGVDDDDTADYLTAMLAPSLSILDGLFNASTGHNHSGAHQGAPIVASSLRGPYDFADWIRSTARTSPVPTSGVGLEMYWDSAGNAGVVQSYDRVGSAYRDTRVRGSAVLLTNGAGQSLILGTDGTTTIPGNLTAPGGLTVSSLSVTTNLVVGGNANITGTLTVGAITTGGGGLNIGGPVTNTGSLSAAGHVALGGYDAGAPWTSLKGNVITDTFFYQRGNGGCRAWDNLDFTYGVGIAANTLAQRDGSGYIQANSVYMPTGAQSGKPTYVCGQNNDGYMRWWPTNAIGPPISTWSANGHLNGPVAYGEWLNFSLSSNPNGLVSSVSGSQIFIAKSGYYYVYAMAQTTSRVFSDGKSWRVRVHVNGNDATRLFGDTGLPNGGGVSRCSAVALVFINAGGYIQIRSSQDSAGAWNVNAEDGYVDIAFVPVADYNN
jgi:hypothetical protein